MPLTSLQPTVYSTMHVKFMPDDNQPDDNELATSISVSSTTSQSDLHMILWNIVNITETCDV